MYIAMTDQQPQDNHEYDKGRRDALRKIFSGLLSFGLNPFGFAQKSTETNDKTGLSDTEGGHKENPNILYYLGKPHLYGPPSNELYNRTIALVDRFKKAAVEEQRIFGIPASVTLAQAIIESAGGTSDLALQAHNYFGVKCRDANKGRPCSCKQHIIHNDPGPEYFKVYDSAWFSIRDHSNFIAHAPPPPGKKVGRYQACFESKKFTDWTRCLKKEGYAADENYTETLNKWITTYKLYVYDEEIPDNLVLPK